MDELFEIAIKPFEWKALRPIDNKFDGDYFELLLPDLFEYRYTVTSKIALEAFRMASEIGKLMLSDKWGVISGVEQFPLWSEFSKIYGPLINHFGENGGVDAFSGSIQYPYAAICMELTKLISDKQYEEIKKKAIVIDNRVTFLRGTAWFDPWVNISQYKGKLTKSVWGSIAREWMKDVFSFFFGRPFVTLQKEQLMLELPGLQSAVWIAFWHNIYPQQTKKHCMSCGSPMITDNPRARKCDDCKREKVRKKDREKKARQRARKKADISTISGFM